ncbi:DUF488 domain-containing protein [Clostridium aestuarii]|uniref:DUF488 domain-containing protein n=1 Tax=Clostridium aestuarii TaxID=338193 RepID=A0ABT4D172_9CLOT|nr:DUF488 domain-containing protein [Clostridium aestuarii]MCY6484993.1 DUF488 domain-containing protein [Clostridium aestuarii]
MVCYTIGHSTRKIKEFIRIIKKYNINYVIDVRNISYCSNKFTEIFNRDILKDKLKDKDVKYEYMGKELGMYPKEYKEFDKVIECDLFKKGIHNVLDKIKKGYNIAIMCSERNPFNCHRSIAIGYMLNKKGIDIEHIIDGNITKNQVRIEEELFITYEPRLKNELVQISIQDILDWVNYDDISEKDIKKKIIEQAYRMKWKNINNKIY